LSTKEARRVYIMEQVLVGKLTIRQAAELLDLSKRQVKRLKGGMKKEGIASLVLQNFSRASPAANSLSRPGRLGLRTPPFVCAGFRTTGRGCGLEWPGWRSGAGGLKPC